MQRTRIVTCLAIALTGFVLAGCVPLPIERGISDKNAPSQTDVLAIPFSLAGYPDEMRMRHVLSLHDEQAVAGAAQLEAAPPIPEGFLDHVLAEPMDKLSLLEAARADARMQGRLMSSGYDIYTYAAEVRRELGPLPVDWFNVLDGEILRITTDGITPATYTADTKADRPPLLTLGDDGQSVPYSRIGRFEGINPETGQPDPLIMWSFIGRRYRIRLDSDDPLFEDVAIIGYNARTGATAFFQMLAPANPKNATCVPSPMAPPGDLPEDCPTADQFWLSPRDTADIGCNKCHAADPFIHTPYVDQVRIPDADGSLEPIVPSSPLGRYWFVGSKEFTSWGQPKMFMPDNNRCIGCHRIGTGGGLKIVLSAGGRLTEAGLHMSSTFSRYPNSHWMPPETSQGWTESKWEDRYGASVEQLISCFANNAQPVCRTEAILGSMNP